MAAGLGMGRCDLADMHGDLLPVGPVVNPDVCRPVPGRDEGRVTALTEAQP
jgi:hypothetical protein